jgi:L-ascorbate metabolism protein UlaG (beta-lactamase superfamily)
MIEPKLADEELLDDIRSANGTAEAFHLWWLGQSGFLVQYSGRHLLLDPYLSDSLTRKYAATDKPHVRISRRVIDPERLDFVNVVTSSHNHTDHLDGETVSALLRVNHELTVVVPAANRDFAADRLAVESARLTSIDDGQELQLDPFCLRAVPAAHELLDRDEQGRCLFLGFLVQFGSWTIYHSGDTIRYPGMVDRLTEHGPINVALLPINGRLPERRVAGNLWGREAAQLAADIGAGVVIPCHYDMFEFNTATPDELLETAANLNQTVRVLALGERFTSHELESR